MPLESTPESFPASADGSPVDSLSHDDLMALVPDMELLESSAIDARTAHAAMAAAAGSGRRPTPAPKLSDQQSAPAARIVTPTTGINDDPYADLMPELEPFEETAPLPRTTTPKLPTAAPRAAAPPTPGPSSPTPAPAAPVAAARAPAESPKPKAPARKFPNPET